ncbi:hypothetical protein [Reichenbachiella sp.]|uniref:hypothetical protein n=1 Tax=Reichenbachiella sp. TaxID=2184521 RepID=UPI003B5ABC7F
MKYLLLLFSLFGFLLFTTSCSDDDSCNIADLEDVSEDLYDDYFDECYDSDIDCSDCEDALQAYIDFWEDNKSCIASNEDVTGFDEDDIDDQIDYLEDQLEDIEDNC